MNKQNIIMDLLPNEVLIEILEYLPDRDFFPECRKVQQIIKLELVCKRWMNNIRSYSWNFIVRPEKIDILIHLLTYYSFRQYNLYSICHDPKIKNYDLDHLFSLLRGCTYLDLQGMGHIILDIHMKYLVNLKYLNIGECYNLTGKYLDTFSNLKSLKIIFNNKFENATFSKLTQLKKLKIHICDRITDEFLDRLINLKKLHISCCNNITNQGIMKLKSLQFIDIMVCKKISIDIVDHLKSRPNIKHATYC